MQTKEYENIAKAIARELSNAGTASNFELSLQIADELINTVLDEAKRIGVKAVAAVCDDGGNIKAVKCMDDSFIASYDIAVNKAYTSVALKMSTKELSKLASPGGSLYGIQHTNSGRIVIFGGGVPLKIGEKIHGGFGVSGGTAEQDSYLGDFAEKKFACLIK